MLTFGTDPEFLIIDSENKPQSAIDVIKNHQTDPISVNGNNFYYDNVLAECTVKPGKSKDEFIENVREAIKDYAEIVKPYRISPTPSVYFPKIMLQNSEAQKINCNPDMCAYTFQSFKIPESVFQTETLRTCGGHIHLGENHAVENETGPEPIYTVYMLDLFLGTASLFLDKDPLSTTRRSLYGQAGRFRKKEYGIEYRSLSNFWLKSPELTSLICDLCEFCVKFIEDGRVNEYWSFDEEEYYRNVDECPGVAFTCDKYDYNELQRVINSGDKNGSMQFMELIKKHLPKKTFKSINQLADKKFESMYSEWQV